MGNTDDDLRMACIVYTDCLSDPNDLFSGGRFHDAGIDNFNQLTLDYINEKRALHAKIDDLFGFVTVTDTPPLAYDSELAFRAK